MPLSCVPTHTPLIGVFQKYSPESNWITCFVVPDFNWEESTEVPISMKLSVEASTDPAPLSKVIPKPNFLFADVKRLLVSS